MVTSFVAKGSWRRVEIQGQDLEQAFKEAGQGNACGSVLLLRSYRSDLVEYSNAMTRKMRCNFSAHIAPLHDLVFRRT